MAAKPKFKKRQSVKSTSQFTKGRIGKITFVYKERRGNDQFAYDVDFGGGDIRICEEDTLKSA